MYFIVVLDVTYMEMEDMPSCMEFEFISSKLTIGVVSLSLSSTLKVCKGASLDHVDRFLDIFDTHPQSRITHILIDRWCHHS